MAWTWRQWRWVAAGAGMLSATSCGYAMGDFLIGDRCFDNIGYWENGVCYDSVGSLKRLPRGWQAVDADELAALTGRAKDWGFLETGGVDLDGDGREDQAAILLDETFETFAVFAFPADGEAVRLTPAQPVAGLPGRALAVRTPWLGGSPSLVVKTADGEDETYAWNGAAFVKTAG